MQIAKSTDLALRVLIYAHNKEGELVTQPEVAEFFQISREHLRKIVHELGQNEFLITRRGKNGGFSLARPARDINIGDVVSLFETKTPMVDCSGLECILTGFCKLKGVLEDARVAFIQSVSDYSLQDIVDNTASKRLASQDLNIIHKAT